ncbi:hypothetical protein DFH07DRAFT_800493 [Mycena maculata]|uniref:Uncharacterized protein n=1 Tax=Mycena maculata TaxID=230809 RepID=A0AAD7NTP4_9AGAR|nr:hypothetical protein DFH07DRAFT_800493 [Mycena maculata]
MPERSGPRVTFFGLVAAVMAALKLKEVWENYKQVPTEEEGRVALGSPSVYRDEPEVAGGDVEAISLLNTNIPVTRPKRKRAKCCVCCGLDCGLFWKAFGIVCALFVLWNTFKLIRWAVTPKPTGLEDMPEYGVSLGCVSAPFIYNGGPVAFEFPVGTDGAGHSFDTRGGAVGTVTLLEGVPTDTTVKYEVTVRTDSEALLDKVLLKYPSTVTDFIINTPHPAEGECMRYDVKMYIPPNLKKLFVASHTVTHVRFDSGAYIQLDDLAVILFSPASDNMILPHDNILSHEMALEVFNGWIVGDAAVQGTTKLTTQRGQGVLNVRVHPTDPVDPASPDAAILQTTTGSGRTDILYVEHEGHVHRPISSLHMSSMNGPMYLTYRDAQYNGRIALGSQSFTATGVRSFAAAAGGTWTHSVGDVNGKDELVIKSKGWTGLYF